MEEEEEEVVAVEDPVLADMVLAALEDPVLVDMALVGRDRGRRAEAADGHRHNSCCYPCPLDGKCCVRRPLQGHARRRWSSYYAAAGRPPHWTASHDGAGR